MAMTPQELQVYNQGRQDAHKSAQDEVAQAKYTTEMTRQGFIFMGRHREYPDNDANAHIMRSKLAAEGLGWTAENMEYIYAKYKDQFSEIVKPAPVVTPAEPTPEEQAAAVAARAAQEAQAAEAARLAADLGITLNMIANWSTDEHRQALANPKKRAIVNRLITEYAAANPGKRADAFLREFRNPTPQVRFDLDNAQINEINSTLKRTL
jgi:hypothetical protein